MLFTLLLLSLRQNDGNYSEKSKYDHPPSSSFLAISFLLTPSFAASRIRGTCLACKTPPNGFHPSSSLFFSFTSFWMITRSILYTSCRRRGSIYTFKNDQSRVFCVFVRTCLFFFFFSRPSWKNIMMQKKNTWQKRLYYSVLQPRPGWRHFGQHAHLCEKVNCWAAPSLSVH